MAYTISHLAKLFHLSRSTLLYYSSIGLLVPSQRTESNYRVYLEEDRKKLEQICVFRQAGIPLQKIKKMLQSSASQTKNILQKRLMTLNDEINALRKQQKLILTLLGSKELEPASRVLTKEKWVKILEATGLSDDDMNQWHSEFEKHAPEAHQDFLESLGLDKKEIADIRAHSITKES